MNYAERLRNVIPGGAHTHTKASDQFPANAPQITTKSQGVYVYDQNGKKYLDYGMALRSVIIGYGEEQVNLGAVDAINNGNTSSFPTMIELEAAERLVGLIDSIEMVKFCKEGSTATTAAVKLSRAYTNRKIVARCADQPFFSTDDWFIGTTSRSNGCLEDTFSYTKQFSYNSIESCEALVEEYPNQIACFILEPAIANMGPEDDFLRMLRELCTRNGIVLIFDEMITGFRWHLKGAQAYYGVTPDLSTFGKAMSNGFPVSVLGGRRELMELGDSRKEDSVLLVSTTHGAENSGLGAFLATLRYMQEHAVLDYVWSYGYKLIDVMNQIAADVGISEGFKVSGLGCLPYFQTLNQEGQRDSRLNDIFQREMANHGIIMRHISIAYRHTDKELSATKQALEQALIIYKKEYEQN